MKLSIVRRQPEPNLIQACPILFRLIPEVFITNVSWCTLGHEGGWGREMERVFGTYASLDVKPPMVGHGCFLTGHETVFFLSGYETVQLDATPCDKIPHHLTRYDIFLAWPDTTGQSRQWPSMLGPSRSLDGFEKSVFAKHWVRQRSLHCVVTSAGGHAKRNVFGRRAKRA